MKEIDLGDDVEIKVKFRGEVYELREPTLLDIEKFQSASDDPRSIFTLLETLGMPPKVLESMSISKCKALIDGLMEAIQGKK